MARAFLAIGAVTILVAPLVRAARRDPNPDRLAVSVTRWVLRVARRAHLGQYDPYDVQGNHGFATRPMADLVLRLVGFG